QAARAADLDAFRAEIFCRLEGFLHGAPERNAALELQRDVLGHQLGVDFRALDLHDIDVNLLAGHRAQLFLELVDFRPFAPDNNAGTRRQNRNTATVGGALDQNLRHRRRFELLLQQIANLAVFGQQLAELFLARVPLRTPIAVDRDAQTDWISFLSHTDYSS